MRSGSGALRGIGMAGRGGEAEDDEHPEVVRGAVDSHRSVAL
jgi:hypothetical protein